MVTTLIVQPLVQVDPSTPIPGPLPIELWRCCRSIVDQGPRESYMIILNNIVDELVRAGTPEDVVVAFLPTECAEAIRPVVT